MKNNNKLTPYQLADQVCNLSRKDLFKFSKRLEMNAEKLNINTNEKK